ncbi:MAG TPA: amidohydrolase family protein [Burkholderiales bacterium]|nr:amidohydrolase family protein [Burkholderiales bacterium]
MAKAYPMLSSDGHLEVLPERWTGRMPAKYRELAPRTTSLPDGSDAIVMAGCAPFKVNYIDLRGGRKAEDWQPVGVKVENTPGIGPPEQRVAEQDADGLAAEVLFPNMVVGPALWRNMRDDGAYKAAVRAYNDWLAEEYCPVAPDRLIGMAVIPWTNLDDALAELTHAAETGLRGVMLGVFPSGKVYPTPEDDRFWAAAREMNMPVTVHVGFNRSGPRVDEPMFLFPDADPAILKSTRNIVDYVARWGLEPTKSIAPLFMSGVFDRFPDFKIFFAETRVGWIPFWLEMADYWYDKHLHWNKRLLGFKPPQRLPSEYVRDNVVLSVQHVERTAIEMRRHFGAGSLMFATDFPHIECDWPETRSYADRMFAGVLWEEAYPILAGNMIRFFHLEDTPMARRVEAQAKAVAW